MADNGSEILTLYEAAAAKNVSVAALKAAIKSGQVGVERRAPVGKARKIEMIKRSALEGWHPGTDSSIKRAATILGISYDEAKRLQDTNKGKR